MSSNFLSFIQNYYDHLVWDARQGFPTHDHHFDKARETITAACEGLSGRALIVGPGACHEIPLKILAERFDHIDLLNIDLRYAKEAVDELSPEVRAKFSFIEADLSGIFEDFVYYVDKAADEVEFRHEFLEKASNYVKNLKSKSYDYQPVEKPSFVCSSLVSTQIVGNILSYLKEISRKKFNSQFEIPPNDRQEFYDSLHNLIFKHIGDLCDWVSPMGKVYYADSFSEEVTKQYTSKKWGNKTISLQKREHISNDALDKILSKRFSTEESTEWVFSFPQKKEEVSYYRDDNGYPHPVKHALSLNFLVTALELRPKKETSE